MVPEGLYVYCVIGTGEARNFGPTGVRGRGDVVTNIAYRDLSAVVSSVLMDRYEVGQEAMLAHERVLEKVMMDHTVLPVRFATIAPNAEDIRSLLRTRYGEFKKLLREMDNKVELSLKALWKDMNQALRGIVAEMEQEELSGNPRAIPSVGKAEAEMRIRLALGKEKAKAQETLLASLRPLAIDLSLNRTYGDDMIMNAAFLVDHSREREFDARVGELSGQFADNIDFRYVGPAPPYSFVNIVIKREPISGTAIGKGR